MCDETCCERVAWKGASGESFFFFCLEGGEWREVCTALARERCESGELRRAETARVEVDEEEEPQPVLRCSAIGQELGECRPLLLGEARAVGHERFLDGIELVEGSRLDV